MKKILVKKYHTKDQANVKVGENDVHSTEELKLWVRPQSAFHLTVGKYI